MVSKSKTVLDSGTVPTFSAFVGGLGIELTPGQRVLCKVAIDGIDPIDLPPVERELASQIFGGVETVPLAARKVLVACFGRFSGKTYLAGLYSLYRALSADVSRLAPGELACALIVAPDVRTARQGLRFALGAAKSVPALARKIESDTADSFVIGRPDGARVVIEVLPATRGGSAVRGRSLVSAVLDECAFFRDESSTINDKDIFAAIAPRILPGGMIVLASTPWLEDGVLYDEYSQNFGTPTTALAAHAPTSLMRTDEETHQMIEVERERDAANAKREFDAEFLSTGTGAYFDGHSIASAARENLPILVPPDRSGKWWHGAGFDPAYRSDASGGIIIRTDGGTYIVAEVFERQPGKKQPLVPSVVDTEFAYVAKKHGCRFGVSDQHYAETVRHHFSNAGLGFLQSPQGTEGKAKAYALTRELLHSGRLIWSAGHNRLTQQMRGVIGRPTPGGGISITQPRKPGSHGDLVSALVHAVWGAAYTVKSGGQSTLQRFVSDNPSWIRSERR